MVFLIILTSVPMHYYLVRHVRMYVHFSGLFINVIILVTTRKKIAKRIFMHF